LLDLRMARELPEAVQHRNRRIGLTPLFQVFETADQHALDTLAGERTEMKQIPGHQAIGAGDHGRHENGTILFRQRDWAGDARISLRNEFHL